MILGYNKDELYYITVQYRNLYLITYYNKLSKKLLKNVYVQITKYTIVNSVVTG